MALQAELEHMQSCLRAAAAAAATGSAQCVKLQMAFSELSQEELAQRKAINNRSHLAKTSLSAARGQIKDQRQQVGNPPLLDASSWAHLGPLTTAVPFCGVVPPTCMRACCHLVAGRHPLLCWQP